MTERKNLTITQVKEIEKVGANQIPKLSFKAKDGEAEFTYHTFKQSLFEMIKEGQTISADVETKEQGDWVNRRIIQVYVDGQPVVSKGGGRTYGKSPEELELSAKSYVLSYAKDLAVAQLIPLDDIIKTADWFYTWLKGTDKVIVPMMTKPTEEQEFETLDKPESPTGAKVQNIAELKGLLMKHKIATHEAYEILSIKGFMELADLDDAWAKIKKAKGIE